MNEASERLLLERLREPRKLAQDRHRSAHDAHEFRLRYYDNRLRVELRRHVADLRALAGYFRSRDTKVWARRALSQELVDTGSMRSYHPPAAPEHTPVWGWEVALEVALAGASAPTLREVTASLRRSLDEAADELDIAATWLSSELVREWGHDLLGEMLGARGPARRTAQPPQDVLWAETVVRGIVERVLSERAPDEAA